MQRQIAIAKTTRFALYAAMCVLAFVIAARGIADSHMLHDDSRSSLISTYDGTAEKPYIYRTLIPQLAHMVNAVTPGAVKNAATSAADSLVGSEEVHKIAEHRGWKNYSPRATDAEHYFPLLAMLLLIYVSLLGYGLTLRALYAVAYPGSAWWAGWAAAFLGVALLVPFIDVDLKLYDFPQLLLVAACLLALQAGQWGWYLVLFLLACINKETALFLVPVFALAFRRTMPRPVFLRLLAGQVLIYGYVMLMLHVTFADNPALPSYLHIRVIPFMLYDDLHRSLHILALLAIYALLAKSWSDAPLLLRACVLMLLADMAVYYAFGRTGEYRVFFDAFPGLTILAGHSLFYVQKNTGTSNATH